MHKFKENIYNFLFWGFFIVFSMLALTACTGKEDIVLNLSDTDNLQEAGESAGTGADMSVGTDSVTSAGAAADSSAVAGGSTLAVAGVDSSAVAGADTSIGGSNAAALLDTAQTEIYVHICGAVVNSGVYKLDEGSRVFEGIEAAGGFREDACEDYVNLASLLKDGERLVIPTMEEIETAKADGTYQELWKTSGADDMGTGETGASENGGGLVNINTATESELGSISGIGAGKAAAIVQYRQENGSFASIEDIMKVSGIKEGTYDKIKDKITVN